jgi:hypothetical protein
VDSYWTPGGFLDSYWTPVGIWDSSRSPVGIGGGVISTGYEQVEELLRSRLSSEKQQYW